MKMLLMLLFFIVCCSFVTNVEQKTRFNIGKFHYEIFIKESYAHDDNWYTKFFIVHRLNKSKELCSAYLSATRNDSTFIKGHYTLFKDRIEFTELYFYYKSNPVWIDSMKKTFYPNAKGDLILKRSMQFKNGKVINANK